MILAMLRSELFSAFVQHVHHISSAVPRVNASLHIIDVMATVTAATAVMNPTAVSLLYDYCPAFC